MAFQFGDGFDHWDDGNELYKWDGQDTAGVGTSIQGVVSRRSYTKFAYVTTGILPPVSYLLKNLSAFGPTVIFGYAFARSEEQLSAGPHIEVGNDTEDNWKILVYDDCDNGTIRIRCGAIDVTSEDTELFGYDEWIHIQVKVTLANSGGTYEVRLNELDTIISGTGDTLRGSSATVDYVKLRTEVSNNTCMFDDFWLLDGTDSGIPGNPLDDFIGDCRVDAIYPKANGYYTDFTPDSGDNYERVHDTTMDTICRYATIDDDDSYVESNYAGNRDSYEFDTLPALGTDIYNLSLNGTVRKTDASPRRAQMFARINDTNYSGEHIGSRLITDTYKTYQEYWQGNPATGTPWTEASVNSGEFGIEVTY